MSGIQQRIGEKEGGEVDGDTKLGDEHGPHRNQYIMSAPPAVNAVPSTFYFPSLSSTSSTIQQLTLADERSNGICVPARSPEYFHLLQ